ncbi:iron complex transport system ATP-binding protein [Lishizhenia tianjinensis]|uniref:Iron complex transport system ATP-binding protein n=1 Tax=Lishizhenia tianjinensis TaxID=477690 RepID=A0A1I6YYM9_9FLAO|nr:ABC transporter ATP-binding protein [Lishizhenia tianjinensis]SFT55527.1 iron complex transport system ATP-binding protein [Lishizhenia tianjinensis]
MFKLKNVDIGYKKKLVHITDLHVEKGKLYALLGKNGSGKTTFLQTLMGNLAPLKGEYLVDGKEIQALSKREKMRYLSYVPSKFYGVEHLSVRELIGMGRAPFTNVLGRISQRDNDKIDEILALLKIEHLQCLSTQKISDGERQIAMIGKALAQEARAIILDEPTAFLDYSNRLKTIQILKEVVAKKGVTVLFSTHNLDLSLNYADNIISINKEKEFEVFEAGIAKELIIEKVY